MTGTKVCSRCKQEKPLDEFSLSRRTSRQAYCRLCANEVGRENYHANKERYFQLARDRDRRLDELINSYKAQPCADCGESYPPYVMDFDHGDGADKEEKISTMRRRRMAFAKIIAEIEKCEVVCANCHRERTNRRSPARYSRVG